MMLTTVFWYLPREIDQFLHLDDNAVLYIYVLMVGIVSPALLTYVILHHRVFDLGFVINRTLVYGVVSAILLGAFGLMEWAADHFVPIAGRGKNVLFDAVLAVVVYLTFNRLEHFVKQTVESLFFRSWQHQEEALRRFVREAAFFTRSKTLLDASIAALNTFAEGAGVAVYMTDENRTFARIAGRLGSAPDMLDPDDPTLVRLRAERQPVGLSATQSHLQAAIAVPMVTRNDVVGIVLLGAKPSGLDFRPDEIELIGWATHQIGLDLQTLKVEQLEVERAELKRSAAELERILRTLRVQST
jgi:GAF domain-containing protein